MKFKIYSITHRKGRSEVSLELPENSTAQIINIITFPFDPSLYPDLKPGDTVVITMLQVSPDPDPAPAF